MRSIGSDKLIPLAEAMYNGGIRLLEVTYSADGHISDEDTAESIRILAGDNELTKVSLSMVCFKYDALLKVDRDKYKNYILDDLKYTYKAMLDDGATTFWETEKGESDFYNAGSLCHGWSGMPVYYFNILLA